MVVRMSPAMASATETDQAPVPDKTHKCPVCGMFVYRYPDFIAAITYTDGHTVFFDGVKDMFKYLFNREKYDPTRLTVQIQQFYVTEYYDIKPVDGRKAHYVIDSDVYGPMGRELIPLQSESDAQQFLKDHHGRKILRFEQISLDIIRQLD